MAVLLSLILLVLSVKHDGTPLRTGCAGDSDVVATLSAGTPLTIRYALPGEGCFKVVVQSGGTNVEGYLSENAILGLEDFEKGRRDAAWLDAAQVVGAIRSSVSGGGRGNQNLASIAAHLIESSQPAKALQLLEPEILHKKDPELLALAGVAAWRNDDSRGALEYWRTSLDLQPNPDVERLYRRVERETQGDRSSDKLIGLRVLLRYDGAAVPGDTARQMLAMLDQEFSRISGQLGCSAEERVVAIVQTAAAYRKTTQAAEWNGGQYDGRIRVPIVDGQGVDASFRRTLSHEITHACLTMIGRWPAWLQEGLAQKLSGDILTPALQHRIADMARQGKLPRLANLGQDWSRMDTDHAMAAYGLSLAAVELFYENYSQYGIANLLRNPERLPDITSDLDTKLGLK